MADLSKIKLNGVEYDIKDAVARELIPTLEPIANVTAMLTSFGLNANANLTQAQTGTAETDHAVAG